MSMETTLKPSHIIHFTDPTRHLSHITSHHITTTDNIDHCNADDLVVKQRAAYFEGVATTESTISAL
jgi:hypothetical protein